MDFQEEIAILIDEWLKGRKGASLGMLSKLSGVHYNTVVRTASKENKPNLQSAMQLLRVLLPRETHGSRAAQLLAKHFPETGYFLQSADEGKVEVFEEFVKLDSFTKSDFVVLSLAGTSAGISKQRVAEKLGEAGTAAAGKLLQAGMLLERDGQLFASRKKYSFGGDELSLERIKWICELFRFDLLDQFGSKYQMITEGLNDDAVLKVHKILDRAIDETLSVTRDPANHGPHVMAYGVVSTFLETSKAGVKA